MLIIFIPKQEKKFKDLVPLLLSPSGESKTEAANYWGVSLPGSTCEKGAGRDRRCLQNYLRMVTHSEKLLSSVNLMLSKTTDARAKTAIRRFWNQKWGRQRRTNVVEFLTAEKLKPYHSLFCSRDKRSIWKKEAGSK